MGDGKRRLAAALSWPACDASVGDPAMPPARNSGRSTAAIRSDEVSAGPSLKRSFITHALIPIRVDGKLKEVNLTQSLTKFVISGQVKNDPEGQLGPYHGLTLIMIKLR